MSKPQKPKFCADDAEEYFTMLCVHYRDEKNRIFARDNQGNNSSNFFWSSEFYKYLGMELAVTEVLEYFSKFDLTENNETEESKHE